MKKRTIKMGQEPIGRDTVARGMWGKFKSSTFRDKRRVLARKAKHKERLA